MTATIETCENRSCMTCGGAGCINGNTWEGDRETGEWVRKWVCNDHSRDLKQRPRAPRRPTQPLILDAGGMALIPALNRALSRRK